MMGGLVGVGRSWFQGAAVGWKVFGVCQLRGSPAEVGSHL